MSYNINSGGQDGEKSGRNEEWLTVIEEESPDIICIQEADDWHSSRSNYLGKYQTALNDYFGDELAYTWGYATNGAAEGWGDEAILSRYPIVNHTWYKYAETEYNGTVVFDNAIQHVTISILDETIHVFNFRLKSGPIFAHDRHLEMIGILSIISKIPEKDSVFVIGDLNSYSPEDVANPSLEPVYAAGAYTLEQAGVGPVTELLNNNYIDTFRTLNPDEKGYTVVAKDWGVGLEPFCRIDYIFISQNKASDLIGSELVESHMADFGSDHYPLTATLAFQLDISSSTTSTNESTSSTSKTTLSSLTSRRSTNFSLDFLSLIAIGIITKMSHRKKD
ncbi:MAG: endonuclease/exonuclease/phosphatase family protein [Candidatus Hodarchaeales archaeon]